MQGNITIPSAHNTLRVVSALEAIVSNLDRIPIEELEDIVKTNNLIDHKIKHN